MPRRKKGEPPEGCRDLWRQFLNAAPESSHDSAWTFFYAFIHCLRHRRAGLSAENIRRLVLRDAPRATPEDAHEYAIAYEHIMGFSDVRKNQLWRLYSSAKAEERWAAMRREATLPSADAVPNAADRADG